MSRDVGPLIDNAQHLLSIGHVDGAIDRLRIVLGEDPDVAEAHALLALCLLNKRRLHAATLEAESALTLAPEAPLSHCVAAELALANRDFRKAEQHAQSFLELAPESAYAYRLLAGCYALTGRDAQRLPLLQQALSKDPNDPESLAKLAEHYGDAGDLGQAWHYANLALQASPENQSALTAMGHVLLLKGEVANAREHAVLALQADPTHPPALQLLVSIKARTNPLLGTWWHYAVWSNRMGTTRSIVVLIVAFVLYRISVLAARDLGHETLATSINLVWLALVVYSFIGPTIFQRALRKELANVSLKDF
jgi:tetratricopeptide (TPR) repeat protein